ncbi:hypothetical protein [Alkaliphilus sp. B6464]|uniref:hypothetical protein n=1 Tax=Alkaliphilus sp. B6464 TaxID=2731219 RepID=UPI001BA48255|nr:hypothetical protein [Alkaliphilus sp. B6464]QUH22016.1 hypothetical protein HYG84_19110 [Alkaliphilus sp. B6464]
MQFLRPNTNLALKTNKGELIITSNEHFIVDSQRGSSVVINKEGIQKIEDHFDSLFTEPKIQQAWITTNNYNVVVTVGLEVDGKTTYGVGCANTLNLANVIAQAYPVEMAVKRAKATCALEVLRKNYIGEERLPLLYSSFDEFQTEDSINKNVEVKEDKRPASNNATVTKADTTSVKENTKNDEKVDPVKDETSAETSAKNIQEDKANEQTQNQQEIQNDTNTSEEVSDDLAADYVIKTNKYRAGITMRELHEKDAGYFKWLATNKASKGRFEEYQQKAIQYAKEENINIEEIA